jgi:magnesium transporter
MPPGSLVYTGKKTEVQPNVYLYEYNGEEWLEKAAKDRLPDASTVADKIRWYEVRGLHNLTLIEQIGRQFGIHPLALEDALDVEQRPKFEEYDNGLFLIVESISWDATTLSVSLEQVSFFTGENFVVSFQENDGDLFAPVRERLTTARGKIRRRGADYLTYALIDNLVDNYYVIIDNIEESLEEVEDVILGNAQQPVKSRIHRLKVANLRIRKAIAPLREAMGRFYRSESPIIKEGTPVFLRDLYDHVVQIADSVETNRDLLNNLHELYLSEISYRMNNVIQILTIISTIFIPLTFLVGVYGMNFEHMPELSWRYGYFFVWILMVAIVLALLVFFRKRKWI